MSFIIHITPGKIIITSGPIMFSLSVEACWTTLNLCIVDARRFLPELVQRNGEETPRLGGKKHGFTVSRKQILENSIIFNPINIYQPKELHFFFELFFGELSCFFRFFYWPFSPGARRAGAHWIAASLGCQAVENDHRNSGFSHEKWWCSI